MKKQVLYIFPLVLMVLALLPLESCKKYEEGPAFTLASKNKRLMRKWEMTAFYVDGVDSTNRGDFTAQRIEFMQSGYNYVGVFRDSPLLLQNQLFSWWWLADKSQLGTGCRSWTLDSTLFRKSILISQSVTWNIMRLTKKELFLESQVYGKHYRLELSSYE